MISHYIGVSNYQQKGSEVLAEHSCFEHKPEEHIMLGEIVFDFKDAASEKLSNYQEAYKFLAKRINETNKIEMFEELLTYQKLVDQNYAYFDNIEHNIKEFYEL